VVRQKTYNFVLTFGSTVTVITKFPTYSTVTGGPIRKEPCDYNMDMSCTESPCIIILCAYTLKAAYTVGAFEKKFGDIRVLRGVRYSFINSIRAVSRAFVNTCSDQLEHALNALSRDCEHLDLGENDFVYMRDNRGCPTAFYFR